MKKNIYYKEIYGHKNILREILQSLITGLAHYPSLIVYVVFRRNMGERFYSLASSITFAVVMLAPVVVDLTTSYIDLSRYFELPWIMFVCTFVGFSVFRRLEFSRSGHIFDTERFSYSEGQQMPFWKELDKQFPFMKFTPVNVGKYYEPLTVFIVGFLVWIIPNNGITGAFLMLTAILHYGAVQVQWSRGRNFILNQIDEIIVNEELANTYLSDEPVDNPRGFNMNCPKPRNMDLRQKVLDRMMGESKGVEVS